MEEESLLEYLKKRLSLKRLLNEHSPADVESRVELEASQVVLPGRRSGLSNIPWFSLLALLLALIGQRFFEPSSELSRLGIGFYILAVCMLVLALIKHEWVIKPPDIEPAGELERAYQLTPLILVFPLIILAFLAFRGNQFTGINLLLWVFTLAAALYAFWRPKAAFAIIPSVKARLARFFAGDITIRIPWWNLLVIGVFLVSAWFHLSQLSSVPLDMTSDHTEKLLDVNDVLSGNHSIFFPRNSGREPIQFYLAATLIKYFGFDLGFTTLKFSMALAFLLSLVYVYRLGREIGNRWTGLLVMLLVGFASWTNILERSGMRLVLTPVFVAPVLFYLLRGLRLSRRNDLVLTGVFLGLGLLGYSAFRIMPFVVIIAFIIHAAYHKKPHRWREMAGGLGLVVLFAIIAALPLISFAYQYPELIAMRTVTRMTSAEQALPGSAWLIFFDNFWKAVIMPVWRDGNTWILSVVNRPALDLVSAGLYVLGTVLALYAWLKHKDWRYLFLVVSIPILMLPSMLALAFPIENPSLSRAGGAAIPILLISAIGFESLFSSLLAKATRTSARSLLIALALLLLFLSGRQNYDLVFNQYNRQYQNSAWNTAQMGEIARDYIRSFGSPDSIWVVAKAHWVDTRLVAMETGFPDRDYAVWPQDLETTLTQTGTKLFFVKADDQEGMTRLWQLYPGGFGKYHQGPVPGRDFYTFIVPSTEPGMTP